VPDNPADPLAPFRERYEEYERFCFHAAAHECALDVLPLLKAVEAVLELAGRALPITRDPDGEPMYWDLSPDQIREAITAELTEKETPGA
jgi:hypothetical protein